MTRGRLKQHTLRVHQPFNYAEPEGLPFDYGGFDDIMQAAEDFQDLEGVPCPGARKVTRHPILDGTGPLSSLIVCTNHETLGRCPCDHTGCFLPPNSPLPLKQDPLPNAYAPFESRGTFQLAEFLYHREQMSAAKIDELLSVMALIYDMDPPFRSLSRTKQVWYSEHGR